MRTEKIKTVKGKNGYHRKPVLVATVHLEDLARKETHEVTGFMSQLLTLLPGINQHHCANGMAGSASERKAARIGFGHIAARVALELATLAGIPVHYASALHPDGPERCQIVIEFAHEAAMRFLLQTAVELVDALVKGGRLPLEARLAEARALIARPAPEPTTRAKSETAALWI
ncbi:MAG: cyanophycin synthetase family protein [Blastocatellia bacterium]